MRIIEITSAAHEMRSLNHSSRANIKVFSGPRNCARKKKTKKDISFPQDTETDSGVRAAFIEWLPEIRNSARAANAKNGWSSASIHPTCHHGVCSYKLMFTFITLHSIKCLKFIVKGNVYCAVRNKYLNIIQFDLHLKTNYYKLLTANKRSPSSFVDGGRIDKGLPQNKGKT